MAREDALRPAVPVRPRYSSIVSSTGQWSLP